VQTYGIEYNIVKEEVHKQRVPIESIAPIL
jgi:hypothetical protein